MTYARPIPTGWEYRQGGEMQPGDIPLTREQYDALCNEQAVIVGGEVLMLDQPQ